MEETVEIDTQNLFETGKHFSISICQTALKKYTEKLECALNFDENIPIFLDTNVLLDYYKISFSERNELRKFFESNKDRIYLTKQIEKEFLTHRIDHIRSYLKSLDDFVNSYKNIKTEIERLKNGEIKGFDHYINKNVILKNDYQDLRTELSNFNETIKQKLQDLFSQTDFEEQIIEKEQKIEEIRKRLEGQADIERNDPLLSIVSEFKIVDELSNTEIENIRNQFDNLKTKYDEVKSDQNLNWKFTFPGCGDKKDDPYGDFIIYHEIIKFLKTQNGDAIFLTNDVEKNDWLLRKKTELTPYTHYIINSYALSESSLFILHAKDKIRVSYSPIYSDQEVDVDTEKVETLVVPMEQSATDEDEFQEEIIKVVGKIDINDFDFNPRDFSIYDDISKAEFLRELKESEKWADKYGSGFVGLNSFIIKYLGGKGFNYRSSYDVKDELLNEGKIETYTHKPENSYYNEVEAIRIKN